MPVRVMLYSLFALLTTSQLRAEIELSGVTPQALEPGKTTQLVLTGKSFQAPLRAWTSCGAEFKAVSVEAAQAVVEVTLPANAQLGPIGFWLASSDGASEPMTLLVDDLPSLADNATNHQPDQAQQITTLCGIDGTSDGSLSDFYRFHVAANQRLAFEVHAQRLGSKMDAVLRLRNASGAILRQADDEANCPDSRFTYVFAEEGDYTVEIFDNRFVAGNRYRLRIGDFPLVDAVLPLAAKPGSQAQATFIGPDANLVAPMEVSIPADWSSTAFSVAAKVADGKSSGWGAMIVSPLEHHVIPETSDPSVAASSLPAGFSGRLLAAKEVDSVRVVGTKGQAIRATAITRSLGLPTMLQMQLFNAAGAKVAETAVNDTDEWSFDFTCPEEGEYRLDVTDILHRGGPEYGYYVELTTPPRFSVAVKPDAKSKERYAIELGQGAAAIDLQVARSGYDGAIDITLATPMAGLELLNSRIDAKATEAKIYVRANEGWSPEALAAIKLVATAVETPEQQAVINSLGLRRIKSPHIPFPARWRDGLLVASAVAPTPAYFIFEPTAPIVFARPQATHAAAVTLKRTQEAFKDAVTVLPFQQPANWNVAAKADKDAYTLTWTRTGELTEPAQLPVLTYSEFNGRGQLQTQQIALQWIDPLKLVVKPINAALAGSSQSYQVQLEWSEQAVPQPVTLAWQNLPAGLTGAPVEIPADGRVATLELSIAADFVATGTAVQLQATSQFAGQPFSLSSAPVKLELLTPPTKLEVYPPAFTLTGLRDERQLVVTGYDAAENARDWTRDCKLTSSNPAVVRVDSGKAFAVADGTAEILIETGTVRQSIPVTVAHCTEPRRTQFENEVLVALSKQSCNSGACHGSPSGKGGFRMSLRAFDPQVDELTLIREEFGRRTNLQEPEKSLLLQKPLMKVAHGGGMQLHQHDPAYEVLRNWIAEGAKPDPAGTPRCVKLELFPASRRVLNRATSAQQQVAAIAHFSDGTSRDVSKQVAYESSNTGVAEVSSAGLVTSHSRGEAAILVRFLEHIESIPLMFIEDVAGFVWQAPPVNNFVDELVDAKLQQLQYLPSAVADDSEFLRRVYLDIIGLLPSVEETNAFLANTHAHKRQVLIDQLLERPEHAKYWALKWGDLLRLTGKSVGDEGVYKYHRWVEQALRENMPYDEFAKVLLTASGSTLSNPAANFYRTATDTNDCVETISQVFLGARLQCAKCHNHPFERWTQDNYYGLGAFFQRVQRKKTQRPGEMFVWTATTGEVTQPRTGQVMKPWLPQVGSIEPTGDEDRRIAFAAWLVQPDNPYFARIEANRIWSHLFSRGIVDPIDDFRDSNPPSNAPLLDALAKAFVDSKFDRRQLLRTILNSRTYQTSFHTNAFNQDDTLYFSHQEPRLLSAEQLLDAVNHTTGTQQTFGPLPLGTKATQLPAPDLVKVDFLKVFGQPERSTVCACERSEDSNLAMAIELFNGPMIYERLRDPKNRFRQALEAGHSIEDTIRELYLAALCRQPTDVELATAVEHSQTRPDPASALEDICWALINTDEFLFQH